MMIFMRDKIKIKNIENKIQNFMKIKEKEKQKILKCLLKVREKKITFFPMTKI